MPAWTAGFFVDPLIYPQNRNERRIGTFVILERIGKGRPWLARTIGLWPISNTMRSAAGADLHQTVDQLRSKVSSSVSDFQRRVSPDAMKAGVNDYLRDKADALMDKARQNPLQAAAVGVGVAYPLWKIVRSVPAPIMMVGAGLYLLGSNSGQKATADISRKLGEAAGGVVNGVGAVRDSVRDAQHMASSGLSSARDLISSGATQADSAAGAAADQLKDRAGSLVSSASDGIGDLKQKAGEAIQSGSDALTSAGAKASSAAKGVANAAADFGADAAQAVRDRAAETSRRATSAIGDLVDQYPLAVGGLGLAVGMLIASVLPKSDIERSVMGGASAEALKRANALASTGFRRGRRHCVPNDCRLERARRAGGPCSG